LCASMHQFIYVHRELGVATQPSGAAFGGEEASFLQ